jgi:hypothetical protein
MGTVAFAAGGPVALGLDIASYAYLAAGAEPGSVWPVVVGPTTAVWGLALTGAGIAGFALDPGCSPACGGKFLTADIAVGALTAGLGIAVIVKYMQRRKQVAVAPIVFRTAVGRYVPGLGVGGLF